MKLEEIEKLCEETTPGPWGYTYDGSSDWSIGKAEDPQQYRVANVYEWDKTDQASRDCKFIAASRELVPKLLAVAKVVSDMRGIGHLPDYNLGHLLRQAIAALEELEKE